MKLETIMKLLREKIADEERLSEEYHVGRTQAFRYCLELLEELEDERSDEKPGK